MPELVDTASIIELKCGCGAGWSITGLLASSDLTGFTSNWYNAGHDHEHGIEKTLPPPTEAKLTIKKGKGPEKAEEEDD